MSKLRFSVEVDLDAALAAGLAVVTKANDKVDVPFLPEWVEKRIAEEGYAKATAAILAEAPHLPEHLASLPVVAKVLDAVKPYADVKVEVVE